MRSIMTTNATVHQQQSSQKSTPQVFTDEELSEIFQINFAEIFGSSSDKPLPKTEVKSKPNIRESPKG